MKNINIKNIVIFLLCILTVFFLYVGYYFYLVVSANSLINNRYCFYKSNCDTSSIDIAIEKYIKAQKLYAESYVYESCALAYYHNKKFDLSYEQFLNAIKSKNRFPLYEKIYSIISFGSVVPSDSDIMQIYWYYSLGDISTKLKNYQQCVDDYTKMIEVASKHGRDSLEKEKRAFCYYNLGMYQEAYKDCIDEKEWLNNKIKLLSDGKLKSAYINRVKKIDNLLLDISKAQGTN